MESRWHDIHGRRIIARGVYTSRSLYGILSIIFFSFFFFLRFVPDARCDQKCGTRFPRSNFFLISGRRESSLSDLAEKEKPELFLRSTPSLHSYLSSGSLDLVARGNKRFRCSEQQESFFTAVADLFGRERGELLYFCSNCVLLIRNGINGWERWTVDLLNVAGDIIIL